MADYKPDPDNWRFIQPKSGSAGYLGDLYRDKYVDKTGDGESDIEGVIAIFEGNDFANVDGPFIVRACQAYEPMLKALKEIAECGNQCLLGDPDRGGAIGDNRSEHNEGYQTGSYKAFNQAAAIAKEAIAKVEAT